MHPELEAASVLVQPENTLTRPSFVQSYHSAQVTLVKSMSSPAKTLVDRAKREEFMAALRLAKEDTNSAKAYARRNPVCSRCEKGQLKGQKVLCIKMSDGIRCCRCRALKQSCPRLVDFWITHVANQLGRSEADVRHLYTVHSMRGSAGAATPASPSRKEVEDSYIESDKDEAGSTVDDQERVYVSSPNPKFRSSTSARTNRPEVRVADNDTELSLKQEIKLLRRRAETAEGNFAALVNRVQDFRMTLRSEIHTMPPGVKAIDGLSRLSGTMETTLDDSGLYLRDISHALKQSRSNWEIHYGTEGGGSKEPRRQNRQRSPEPDGNSSPQKRRKI